MSVASAPLEVHVTLRTAALVGAFLLAVAGSAAAQIVVGYPGPPWSRGTYDLSSSLRIESKPPETEVYVDGYFAGKVDEFDGRFQRLRVEPGEHEIAMYLPGYRLYTQKVYLQPGNTFKIRHDMEKLAAGETPAEKPSGPPRAERSDAGGRGRGVPEPARGAPRGGASGAPGESYGTVSIRVQPADAEIFIDRSKWDGAGDDRLLIRLDAGVHRVEVRKSGYRGYLTEVTIRGGETTPLNIALAKEP
jgi:hypothetical protein